MAETNYPELTFDEAQLAHVYKAHGYAAMYNEMIKKSPYYTHDVVSSTDVVEQLSPAVVTPELYPVIEASVAAPTKTLLQQEWYAKSTLRGRRVSADPYKNMPTTREMVNIVPAAHVYERTYTEVDARSPLEKALRAFGRYLARAKATGGTTTRMEEQFKAWWGLPINFDLSPYVSALRGATITRLSSESSRAYNSILDMSGLQSKVNIFISPDIVRANSQAIDWSRLYMTAASVMYNELAYNVEVRSIMVNVHEVWKTRWVPSSNFLNATFINPDLYRVGDLLEDTPINEAPVICSKWVSDLELTVLSTRSIGYNAQIRLQEAAAAGVPGLDGIATSIKSYSLAPRERPVLTQHGFSVRARETMRYLPEGASADFWKVANGMFLAYFFVAPLHHIYPIVHATTLASKLKPLMQAVYTEDYLHHALALYRHVTASIPESRKAGTIASVLRDPSAVIFYGNVTLHYIMVVLARAYHEKKTGRFRYVGRDLLERVMHAKRSTFSRQAVPARTLRTKTYEDFLRASMDFNIRKWKAYYQMMLALRPNARTKRYSGRLWDYLVAKLNEPIVVIDYLKSKREKWSTLLTLWRKVKYKVKVFTEDEGEIKVMINYEGYEELAEVITYAKMLHAMSKLCKQSSGGSSHKVYLWADKHAYIIASKKAVGNRKDLILCGAKGPIDRAAIMNAYRTTLQDRKYKARDMYHDIMNDLGSLRSDSLMSVEHTARYKGSTYTFVPSSSTPYRVSASGCVTIGYTPVRTIAEPTDLDSLFAMFDAKPPPVVYRTIYEWINAEQEVYSRSLILSVGYDPDLVCTVPEKLYLMIMNCQAQLVAEMDFDATDNDILTE